MKTESKLKEEIIFAQESIKRLKSSYIKVKKGKLIPFFALPHTRNCIDLIYKCNDILENMVGEDQLPRFAKNEVIDDYWDQCSSVQFFINEKHYNEAREKLSNILPYSCFGKYEPATYKNAGVGGTYLSRNR